jgi:hypothetical protein
MIGALGAAHVHTHKGNKIKCPIFIFIANDIVPSYILCLIHHNAGQRMGWDGVIICVKECEKGNWNSRAVDRWEREERRV